MDEIKPHIKVLIVDDHPLMRAGVGMILEDSSDIRVVGEAADGKETLSLARQEHPDVIILDISMPEMSGLEATERILDEMPRIRILVLTSHDDQRHLQEFLRLGTLGYLLKGAPANELLAAIHAVSQGQPYISSALAKKIVESQIPGGLSSVDKVSNEGLTERELEVLRLIAEDRTSREIAEALVLSVNTVDRHRTNLMRKLDLHSKTELVKYAIREGLVKL